MSNQLKDLIKEKVASGELNPNDFGPLPTFPRPDAGGIDPIAISCWIGSC